MAEELRRFEDGLEGMPIAVFAQDLQMRYIWIYNPFYWMPAEEILGETEAAFLPEDEAAMIARIKQEALDRGEARQARVQMTLAGQSRPCFLSVRPSYEADGSLSGLTGILIDLSDLPLVEGPAELKEFNSDSYHRLLASLSRQFAETGNDYPAILDTIARLVAEAAGDACLIRLAGEEDQAQPLVAFHHVDPVAAAVFQQVKQNYQLSLAEGRKLVSSPIVIGDYMARPDLLARLPADLRVLLNDFPIHAVMVLPLRTSRYLLGTFTVWRSRTLHPYSADDLVFWKDVADLAALAIENARLYAEEVQRNRQLNALHDATTALLSTLDLEVLLGRILDAAQRAIPAAERGILYLVAPRTGRLEVRAVSGFGDPRIRHATMLQNTHANRSMRERRPLLIRDALAEESTVEYSADLEGEELENLRSEIIAPLLLGEEVLGALSLSSSRPFAFDLSELQLLVSFAATTTAAIHNATLHTELQKIAITDSLTGLYNRRGLLELGRHEVERFQRFHQPLSAIMLDIDHFKNVNDTYGHPVGDQVLRGLAERCRSLIRQVDIIGRYGGEEFAILLPETDLFQASEIAERLRGSVEEAPFLTEQGPISITVSLGVSRAGRRLASLVTLIEQADAALYQAKQNGRNRVEIG